MLLLVVDRCRVRDLAMCVYMEQEQEREYQDAVTAEQEVYIYEGGGS